MNCTFLNVSVLHSVFLSVARLMFLLIYSKLDRVIPFLRGFGSPWRDWIRLGICPWNWWSADETHRRRCSALLLPGCPPLPPFAARTHFPLSIYADIAGNLRGEVETSSRLEEALHMSSLDHSFSSRQWPVKSNELLV